MPATSTGAAPATQLESIDDIEDSLAVGQAWRDDLRIVTTIGFDPGRASWFDGATGARL
jgi:hypothetical protein